MKEKRLIEEVFYRKFETSKRDYYKWAPIFQRLGLKPHRFCCDREAVYVGTSEGWFRLSLVKYEKQELKWLRSILEYLEEREFNNWATTWQKTIIWEENSHCYLIQPWLLTNDHFKADDPASVARIAEILADFYRSGKDYHENKGIAVMRDRWSTIETQWSIELERLEQLSGDFGHEKFNKEFSELKKESIRILSDALSGWRSSGISALYEHHRRTGVLGHGNLKAENIIWCGNDYYLLNWEHLAFQPKIADLASLIRNAAIWEPDWIIFLITEYSKIQPFWSEEYAALIALLRYPAEAIRLLTEVEFDDLERKNIKEEVKQLARKERCLGKVWKELGISNRWVWGRANYPNNEDLRKISMVLSPIESWGDFSGPVDSLIKIDDDQKLPLDVIERLTFNNQKGVVSGKEGNILEGAANGITEFTEITEKQPPRIIEEVEEIFPSGNEINANIEIKQEKLADSPVEVGIEENPGQEKEPSLIKWNSFPKVLIPR